jgi:PAS domain S-box-containing protein
MTARKPTSARSRVIAAGSVRPPRTGDVIEAILDISKEISFEMSEETLLGRYGSALTRLFPGRPLALRVIDPRTFEPTSEFATAEIAPYARMAPLAFKPSALKKMRVSDQLVRTGRVSADPVYKLIFHDTAGGFSVPLVANGELFGALNVEYPLGAAAKLPAEDEAVMLPLANQLSVSLRNLKLAAETLYLRDYTSALLDEANALVFAVDRRRRVVVWNRALARISGYSPKSVLNQDAARWLGEGKSELLRALDAALDGRTPPTIEYALATRSGGVVRAAWNVAAVRSGSHVESVIAIGQDLTHLKTLERQVLQAEKLATLGQIAAGVVHELNNPLTSITVYADYLLKKLDRPGNDPGDVEKLRKITDASARMLRFTRDLVTYARPSGEERDLVIVDDVIAESLSFCEHVLSRAKVRVATDFGTPPPIRANRGQLQQVFINLITNAAQSLPKKGGGLRVATQAENDAVRVIFADDGCGIRSKDLPKIFEPFFTTKEPGSGTGLGLSIVRSIVERHGGRVTVASDEQQGSEFVLVFPRGHAAGAPKEES